MSWINQSSKYHVEILPEHINGKLLSLFIIITSIINGRIFLSILIQLNLNARSVSFKFIL